MSFRSFWVRLFFDENHLSTFGLKLCETVIYSVAIGRRGKIRFETKMKEKSRVVNPTKIINVLDL